MLNLETYHHLGMPMILRKGKDDRNGGEDAPSIKIFVRMGLLLYGLYIVR